MNIGTIRVKNRLIRSATYEAMGLDEGYVTALHLNLYRNLAEGGVGLIITGNAYVHPMGQTVPGQLAVFDDKLIPELNKIVQVIREAENDCKVVLQIAHCGRQSLVLDTPIAPSAVYEASSEKLPREMTSEEIKEVIEEFAQAVRRGKEAGFDGIQIHGAHGYLISSFLSPYTNRREDGYGGSWENRSKILVEIYNRAVELVGEEYPIMLKMNGTDFMPGGLQIEEAKKIAERLASVGFAAFEISGGMWEVTKLPTENFDWRPVTLTECRVNIGSEHAPAYNLPFAKEIKSIVDVPVITVGGINTNTLAEEIIKEGSADFIALSRPLIREPDLPNKWLESEGEVKVKCIYCNGCIRTLSKGKGVHCAQESKEEV